LTTALRRALLWGPVLAYVAVIFYLSAQSSPPVPGGVPDWVLHSIEYFGFAVFVFRAVAGGLPAALNRTRVLTTISIVTAYAISDELHQAFVPDRTPDIRDIRSDVAGASVALLACWAWHIIASSGSRRANLRSPR
jgi:VanZ family protein